MARVEVMYGNNPVTTGSWNNPQRFGTAPLWMNREDTHSSDSSFPEPYQGNAFDNKFYRGPNNRLYQSSHYSSSGNHHTNSFTASATARNQASATYPWNNIDSTASSTPVLHQHPPSAAAAAAAFGSSSTGHGSRNGARLSVWDDVEYSSPTNSVDDIINSPNLSEYSLENTPGSASSQQARQSLRGRPQRRPNNRDEFDGPHQFLQRPSPEIVARQERELPHLPTHLLAPEQDAVLNQVNDRLSECAYYFIAKYQFPVPLIPDLRTVEGPLDREWTEWVYLLKRLATKRRIPAKFLYNGQIKQFVTVLENSLETRHIVKHQGRPLRDDRNILQLISAGIQVAKILKDATAMECLDRLYVSTEQQIAERAAKRFMK